MRHSRRTFLRDLAVGAATVAAGSTIGAAEANAIVPATPGEAAAGDFDMSWVDRVTRPHRFVVDIRQTNGTGLSQAANWMKGFAEAYGVGDSELNLILVMRHDAASMVLSDPIWERLAAPTPSTAAAGTTTTAPADSSTARRPTRNPWLAGSNAAAASDKESDPKVDTLMARGAIVLVCNLALGGQAYKLRQKEPQLTEDDSKQQIRAHVIPGVYVMPNGVFAVGRAQEAGCSYFIPG